MTVPITGASPVPPIECTSCTVPVDQPGLCSFCADPPPPLDLTTEHEHRCTHCGDVQTVPCDQVVDLAEKQNAADTRLLDAAANYASIALEDLEDAAGALPSNASLWVSVDITRAMRHLRGAIRLIEHAGALLDEEAVAR